MFTYVPRGVSVRWWTLLAVLGVAAGAASPSGARAGEIPPLAAPAEDPLMSATHRALRAEYQEAQGMMRRGQLDAATERLTSLEARYEVMAGPIRRDLASLSLRQGRYDDALRWADAVLVGEADEPASASAEPRVERLDADDEAPSERTDVLVSWGLALRGEALYQLGRYGEAESSLEEALLLRGRGGPSRARLHEQLGAIAEARGDAQGAWKHYRMAVQDSPTSSSGRACQAALDRLRPSLGSWAEQFDLLLEAGIIEDLLASGKEREALRRVEAALGTCTLPDVQTQLRATQSRCMARLAAPDEAVVTLEMLVQSTGLPPATYWGAVKDLQKLLGKQKDVQGRIDVLRRYLETFPTEAEAIEARMILASVFRDRGQWDQAELLYREIADLYPGRPEADDARWLMAWSRLRQRDLTTATSILMEHVQTVTPGTLAEARALYWLARLTREEGRYLSAWWLWVDVVRRFPNTYYGAMSQWQMAGAVTPGIVAPPDTLSFEGVAIGPETLADGGTLTPGDPLWALARSVMFPGFEEILSHVRSPHAARQLRRAMEYSLMGESSDALSELAGAVEGVSPDPGALLMAAALYHSSGQTYRGLRYAHQHLAVASLPTLHGPRERRWGLAYPFPWAEHFVREALRMGLQPALLAALSQQESTFVPDVRSPVGATGLMQLMPATARQVARQLGLRKPKVRDLYDPALNTRLGTAYLRMMLEDLGGSVPLALAAYNAGPGAVTSWQRRLGRLDDDVMVEEIPYRETRHYVQVVLRNYAGYLAVYPSLVQRPQERTGRLMRLPAGPASAPVPSRVSLDEPGSFVGPGGAFSEEGVAALASDEDEEDDDAPSAPRTAPSRGGSKTRGGATGPTQPARAPARPVVEPEPAPGEWIGPGGVLRGVNGRR